MPDITPANEPLVIHVAPAHINDVRYIPPDPELVARTIEVRQWAIEAETARAAVTGQPLEVAELATAMADFVLAGIHVGGVVIVPRDAS